jgi:hypothetical protein
VRRGIDAQQPLNLHRQPGFLPHLAHARLDRAFARIHAAAGQAPAPVVGALRQQHLLAAGIEHDRRAADAQLCRLADAVSIEQLRHLITSVSRHYSALARMTRILTKYRISIR